MPFATFVTVERTRDTGQYANLTIPQGVQAGDLLLFGCLFRNAAGGSVQDTTVGWSLRASRQRLTDSPGGVWSRVATADDVGKVYQFQPISFGSGTQSAGVLVVLRNASYVDITMTGTGSSTSHTLAPNDTAADATIVHFVQSATTTKLAEGDYYTFPAEDVERGEAESPNSGGYSVTAAATHENAAGGIPAAHAATWNPSSNASQSFSIEVAYVAPPAPSGQLVMMP